MSDDPTKLRELLQKAEAEVARWRDEYATAQVEHIRMRDRYSLATKNDRAHEEAVYEAAERRARDGAAHYIQYALRTQLDPLRDFLKHCAAVAENATAAERRGLADRAERLLRDVERDPDATAALKVVTDMEAANDRLLADKAVLWNTLRTVREAVRDRTLAELQVAPARLTEQEGGIPNDAITPDDPYKRGI